MAKAKEFFDGVKSCEAYLAERAEPGAPIVKGEERNPHPSGSDEWWQFQDGWYDRMNLDLAEDDLEPTASVDQFETWFSPDEE